MTVSPPARARASAGSSRAGVFVAGGAALALAAGCTSAAGPPDAPVTSPFADCAAVPAAAATAELPDLSLPCFTGGQQVALTSLRGPAVINLWASWCGPCREELPAMQRLADRTAGKLTVLGVDTGDDRDSAASFAAEKGVRLPTLFDRDKKLLGAVGGAALPVTVFIDADGRRTVHPLPIHAEDDLVSLVREHTGVSS